MSKLSKSLKNLVTDERGNVAMTFGLTSLIAVAAVGGALDFGRSYQMKSRMQNALDASVVSGIAKYRDGNDWTAAKAEALAVFNSMFTNSVSPSADNPNPAAGLDQPLVAFTQSGTQLTGAAQMKANTPFMNLVIGSNLTISAVSNAVPPAGKMLEVAVMVDLTGSMGWDAAAPNNATPCGAISSPQSKLDYLKCAGEDLLNILLPASGVNNGNVKIGVAPFSDKVNAGEFAAEVTGLSDSGGAYANITDLAKTKQSPWSGTYAVAGAQPTGSQFGAMGAVATSGSTVTTAGATYNNAYCASPTSTTTVATYSSGGYRVGVEINRDHDNPYLSVPGIITLASGASYSDAFKKIDEIDGSGSNWYSVDNGTDNKGYFVPLPQNHTSLTKRSRTANWDGNSRTGTIGASVSYESDIGSTARANLESIGFVRATSSNGYWRIKEIDSDGNHDYEWKTSGWYIPLYESLTTTSTVAGCETPVVTQPTSKLITCVTERKDGSNLDFTADAIASGRYVGPYNHGSTSKSNYSSDGKCYSAGRELPAVIPLTNERSTLTSFFTNATAGGATAGHLGTAWASYLLSPDWSNIWPAASQPAAYTNAGVKKAAILMTDGEYNIQFSVGGSATNTSPKQALMLCKEMRAKGIEIFTIGFGFGANATPPNPDIQNMSETDRTTPLGITASAKDRALDTLAKCASNNNSYYFPYDGEELRQVFKSIANGLSSDLSGGKARLTQ